MTTKRNRYNNSVAQASRAVYPLNFSNGERLIISFVLGQIDGLDREGSRKTAAIIEELDLENMGEVSQENMDETAQYELSGFEIRFLCEELDNLWEGKKIKAVQARHSVSVYDKMKAALEVRTEEPEAAE